MPHIQFIGHLTPQHTEIEFDHDNEILWLEADLEFRFRVQIGGGGVLVDCEVGRWDAGVLVEAYRMALELARAPVNLVSFMLGEAVAVSLDELVEPDGRRSALRFNDDLLPPLVTAVDAGDVDYSQVVHFLWSNPSLMIALNDLIEAIHKPHAAPINCGRAVEALRRQVCTDAATDAEAWCQFRNRLRLSEPFVRAITDTSRMPRHGNFSFIPGEVTRDVTRRAWIIMNRYLEYMKRGGVVPLPLEQFPEVD